MNVEIDHIQTSQVNLGLGHTVYLGAVLNFRFVYMYFSILFTRQDLIFHKLKIPNYEFEMK